MEGLVLISKSWNQMEQDGVRWKKNWDNPTLPIRCNRFRTRNRLVGFLHPADIQRQCCTTAKDTVRDPSIQKKTVSLLHQGGRGHAGSQVGSCLPYKWPTDQKCSTQTCGPCKCICGQPRGIPPASHQLVSSLHPSCGWKCSEKPFCPVDQISCTFRRSKNRCVQHWNEDRPRSAWVDGKEGVPKKWTCFVRDKNDKCSRTCQ